MHRKIIKGTGKAVVHAVFDDGSKQTLTFFGPSDEKKIDEKLKAINKERGSKSAGAPQDTEVLKLQDENKTLRGENESLQKKLEDLKKDSKSDKPEAKSK